MTTGATEVRPDESRELSDGVVVQAQLLGRVLGLRVLRVDGTVLLSPARVDAPAWRADGTPYADGDLAEAARLLRVSDEALKRC